MTRCSLFCLAVILVARTVSPQDIRLPTIDLADTTRIRLLNAQAKELLYNKPDSAIEYANYALELSKEVKDIAFESKALFLLGAAHYVKGAYEVSLDYTLRSLSMAEEVQSPQDIALAVNNVGLVYLAQNKADEAADEFKRSLTIARELNDLRLQSTNNFNLGLSYELKNQIQDAKAYFEQALSLSRQAGDMRMEAMSLNRLGETLFRLKEYEKSISRYLSVINNRGYKNDWETSFAYSGIAQTKLAQGFYTEAIINAQKALDLARSVNAKWDIERCMKILYTAYAAKKDFKQAFEYLQLNKLYSDSLYNEAKENEINGLFLKQKNRENQQLQAENQLKEIRIVQNTRIITLIAIFSFLLLIALAVIVYYLGQKNKLHRALQKKSALVIAQNEKLGEMDQVKNQLFSVIGHDLRSPFSSMLQAIEMYRTYDLSPEDNQIFLNNFFENITVTASMLDNLVLWAQGQRYGIKADIKSVDLALVVDQQLALSDFLLSKKKIAIQHEKPAESLIEADPDQIRIIIHNLIANAIKFTPTDGNIKLYYLVDNNYITIHISDTGIGMPDDKLRRLFNTMGKDLTTYGTNNERGIGIGLMLVKEFAENNNAEIYVRSKPGEGTDFSIRFVRWKRSDA